MKMHTEALEEANLLFEMIKTMLITGLPQTEVSRLLKFYSHFEIRNGKYVDGEFIVQDLVSFVRSE